VPPTVRIYSWAEPCHTIGYLQRISELKPALLRHPECKCVRRLTGGRAFLHGGDLSYSLIVSLADNLLPANVVASYERISSGVIEGLRLLGIDARYAAPTDVQMDGRSIATAAQARRQGVLLHQGTIALKPCVLDAEQALQGQALTPISELVGGEIDIEDGARALGMGMKRALGVDLSPSILFAKEKRLARQLWREKYMRPEWNLRR
jgi:lipoate-protein ligase A